VFELFVRSQSYEADVEAEVDIDASNSSRDNRGNSSHHRTHSFLQMLAKPLTQSVSTSSSLTNSNSMNNNSNYRSQSVDSIGTDFNLQLSTFQLQICRFLCYFVKEYKAPGLTVLLGLSVSDNELASIGPAKALALRPYASPVKVTSILNVSSHRSVADLDAGLFRACVQLWMGGARLLDVAEYFEYIPDCSSHGGDILNRVNNIRRMVTSTSSSLDSRSPNMDDDDEMGIKKQQLYSTISDIVFELTMFLDSVAERVSTVDWILLTGDLKAPIHTQLWMGINMDTRHASLRRCEEFCKYIDSGGVDLGGHE